MAKIEIGKVCGIIRHKIVEKDFYEKEYPPQQDDGCYGTLEPHPGMFWFLVCSECKAVSMRPAY